MRYAVILLSLWCTGAAGAQVFQVPADANYPFTLTLVDETDGYTAETEKKAADTTITYCRVTDSNTPATFTDVDTTHWREIGNGTGDYRLMMGALQFTEPNEVYFVKIVVSGCRTVRLRVETQMPLANHYSDSLMTTSDAEEAAANGTAAAFAALEALIGTQSATVAADLAAALAAILGKLGWVAQ